VNDPREGAWWASYGTCEHGSARGLCAECSGCVHDLAWLLCPDCLSVPGSSVPTPPVPRSVI
jgi:hypothetical protein